MHPISLLLLCLQTVRLSAFIADQQQRPLLHAPVGITGSSHIPALRAKNGNKKADDDDGKGGGYKFGDISRGLASRFTKRVEQVTGKEYEFGDLTRHLDKKAKGEVEKVTGKEYEFGDLSRWADARVKQRVTEITGKDDYQVGDLSKELLRRLLAGEVKWDEVLMLLKLLLSLGASFSPIGGMLPAKVLVDLLNYSIAAQVGEKVTGAISTELDRRMKEAVTGNPDYQLGDLTKAQMLKFIGKDEYSFGDLTKTVMQKLDAADKSGEKDRSNMLLFSDTTHRGDETTDRLELTNEQVLAELDSWDKAFKVEVEGNKK
mmetsp:Transcript_36514/g.79871  ORF Transcript_36514/g.79871 Transcript_36514/m.79871 type:complete len:317 (+) Transcript_36514:55-1005(+)